MKREGEKDQESGCAVRVRESLRERQADKECRDGEDTKKRREGEVVLDRQLEPTQRGRHTVVFQQAPSHELHDTFYSH